MLRQATLADVDRLAELEAVLFNNAMPPSLLERELGTGFGYVIGDPIYAYALVRKQGDLLDLTRLGVEPAHQGQGTGARLLDHVLSLGYRVQLTVLKNNHRALQLYLSRGFEIVAQVNGETDSESAWVAEHRLERAPSQPER
jgi:ribosomal-protein-alanine N-acetyltransferase